MIYFYENVISYVNFSNACLKIRPFQWNSKIIRSLVDRGFDSNQITIWQDETNPHVLFVHNIKKINATHIKIFVGGQYDYEFYSNFFETIEGKILSRAMNQMLDESSNYTAWNLEKGSINKEMLLVFKFLEGCD